MNILVVGNGFDIAHDLPTGYKDFLRFTEAFAEFKTERRILGNQIIVKEESKEIQLIKYLENLFSKATTSENAKKLIDEIDELITDNKWIEHFKKINIAQGWIDFEGEIAKIIKVLDGVRIKTIRGLQQSGRGEKITTYEQNILSPYFGQASFFTSVEPLNKRKEEMLDDLNRLTRCLEIYLCDYVEKIPVEKKLSDIKNLDIHAVVSFNYTDIYRANYVTDFSEVECDFIHGKAEITHNKETCNMVIGIDEYLEGTAREKDNEYIQFKKFFQRIYKATGCDYVDWLEKIKPRLAEKYCPDETNLYIYGHSLDDTDKDVLARLITAENVKTTIFYHNQDALGKQISNLVKVITEEELISRTGKKNIVFKKTKE